MAIGQGFMDGIGRAGRVAGRAIGTAAKIGGLYDKVTRPFRGAAGIYRAGRGLVRGDRDEAVSGAKQYMKAALEPIPRPVVSFGAGVVRGVGETLPVRPPAPKAPDAPPETAAPQGPAPAAGPGPGGGGTAGGGVPGGDIFAAQAAGNARAVDELTREQWVAKTPRAAPGGGVPGRGVGGGLERTAYDAAIRRQRRLLYGGHLAEDPASDPEHLSDAEASAEMRRNAGLLHNRSTAAGTPPPETRNIVNPGIGAVAWQRGGSAQSANEQLAKMKEYNRSQGFGRSHPIGRRRDWVDANNADRTESARRFDAQIAEYQADRASAETQNEALRNLLAQQRQAVDGMQPDEKAKYEADLARWRGNWRGIAEGGLRTDPNWFPSLAEYSEMVSGLNPALQYSYGEFLDYLEGARKRRPTA